MKKILIILNESEMPQHVIKSALRIGQESKSFLEAIFINDLNNMNADYPFPNDLYLTNDRVTNEMSIEASKKRLENSVQEFKDKCIEKGIAYKIEIDKSVSIKHLIKLSSYADLIITDATSDSIEYSLKDLLADAHCPLLLISKNAVVVEKIYVAYDGSTSSMYALKMFSYIFPEYKNFNIHFFQISKSEDSEITQLNELESWVAQHYANANYELIKGNTDIELMEHIRYDAEKTILVMGAYSGSSIRRLFLKSTADAIIKNTNVSLFITHV
jgi:nucleotide-binding universal stress UspA family protein